MCPSRWIEIGRMKYMLTTAAVLYGGCLSSKNTYKGDRIVLLRTGDHLSWHIYVGGVHVKCVWYCSLVNN